MPRGRHTIKKRKTQELDSLYGSALIMKFINRLMRDGEKNVAQRVVYGAFDIISQQGQDPLQVFNAALENVGPRQEVRPRRIGGAAYQIPVEVRGERKISLAIRWILGAVHKRSNKEYNSFSKKLAAELLDASRNQGEAIKKRDITQRMADANKAFAHFRW